MDPELDDYPHWEVREDGWLHTDGLHHPGFPTLLNRALERFITPFPPRYRGRSYREFGVYRYEVEVEIPRTLEKGDWVEWTISTRGTELEATLNYGAQRALRALCEAHLSILDGSPFALLPGFNLDHPDFVRRLDRACNIWGPDRDLQLSFLAPYLAGLCSVVDSIDRTVGAQRDRLEVLTDVAELRSARIDLLEGQVTESQERVGELEGQLGQSQDRVAELEGQLENAQQIIGNLHQELHHAEQAIDDLQIGGPDDDEDGDEDQMEVDEAESVMVSGDIAHPAASEAEDMDTAYFDDAVDSLPRAVQGGATVIMVTPEDWPTLRQRLLASGVSPSQVMRYQVPQTGSSGVAGGA